MEDIRLAPPELQLRPQSAGTYTTAGLDPHHPDPARKRNKLVLCFDGTGNKFRGDHSDTNIVKICRLLDRTAGGQFHYYQPGIGTYIVGTEGKQRGPYDRTRAGLEKIFDSMTGASFHDHVIAGYTFIMRYYRAHDDIYIFGFSRGAYTARFLTEMLDKIGLLSRGNEEMIRFAWRTYEKYEKAATVERRNFLENYMREFKDTFCRDHIRIRFLGLFDCVNSVGSLEVPLFRRSFSTVVSPPAEFVRHAVSIDERRAKFKPALFDVRQKGSIKSDLKEVWFPGGHSDVGGGYYPSEGDILLSDLPLAWMINELINLPIPEEDKLCWDMKKVDWIMERIDRAYTAPAHDALSFTRPYDPNPLGKMGKLMAEVGHKMTTLNWWIMELCPIFTRLELVNGKWVPTRFPPNAGLPRDIPPSAVIHNSVAIRASRDASYRPDNDGLESHRNGNGNKSE